MQWIELITVLSGLQLIALGWNVGKARTKHGLAHPAMAGEPTVERHIRAHLNSVEWLGIFLPALWIAAKYWNPMLVAGIGAVYLIGRVAFAVGYVRSVKGRAPGFAISSLATIALIILSLIGIVRTLLA